MQTDDVISKIEEYFHVLHLGEKSLDLGKILSTDTSIKILEQVYNSDNRIGLSSSEISDALDIGRTTVIYHLGRMQESGLIKVNPTLESEEKWKEFWELYRTGRVEMPKDQFNRLHDARMNGVKLFVPTKKGFIVLPSTDAKTGQGIVREALVSIATSASSSDYKRMVKSTGIMGTLGLLFLAFSFLFQGIPFMQQGKAAMAPTALLDEVAVPETQTFESQPSVVPSEALSRLPSEQPVQKDAREVAPAEKTGGGAGEERKSMIPVETISTPVIPPASMAPVLAGEATIPQNQTPESPIPGPTGGLLLGAPAEQPEPDVVMEKIDTEKNVTQPIDTVSAPALAAEEEEQIFDAETISKVFSYIGTLLLGSTLGFFIYYNIRKK